MNVNFGIMKKLDYRVKGKRERYEEISRLAVESLKEQIAGKEV